MTENQQIRRVPCELCDGIAEWEHKGKWYCERCIERVTLKILVFTRVVGYIAIVAQFNKGKKQEQKERLHYVQPTTERLNAFPAVLPELPDVAVCGQ